MRDDRRWLPALAIYERLQAERPDDTEVYRLRVLTLAEVGNSYLAWRQLRARPELFDAGQRERLEANYLARLIVWAQTYPEDEKSRLAEARVADAAIQEYLHQTGREVSALPRRIRVDRLILLNEMGRHQQVVDEYRSLTDQQGQSLPGYALPAVGDSLMSLKRPEDAAPVLEAALKADPDNPGVRTLLTYAYLESEQADIAVAQLEAYRAAQPPWRRMAGAKQNAQNWGRYDADVNLAMLHAYTENLPGADTMLSEMLAIAPNNAGLQSSLGTVYMMRGWPSRALERFRIASTVDERNVESRIGQVEALTVLRRDDQAISLHDQLLRDYPNQPSVQRMDQMWRNHRGWQWRTYVSGDRSDGNTGNSPLGSRDGQYGVEVQTPILGDRWRLTAGADDRWADFQQQRVHYRRQGVGVRYAYDQLDTSLSAYHANDRVGGTGIDFDANWRFSDTWEGSVQLRRNDAEASLQARASGITADSAGVVLAYTRDERSAFRFGATQWRYEDGNRRTGVNLSADQRLLSRPYFLLNGFAGLYASHGSRDDTPYFNPSRDASMELGLRADQLVWRDYDYHFRHRLTVSAGPYWQDGYGSAWVPSLAYRHEWQLGMGHVLTYGVSWSRPVYDGNREERFGFDAELRWGE